MIMHEKFYLNPNGKPTRPEDEPIDPKDPDDPVIEDPVEPTEPNDPIQEPIRSSSRYDPNNFENYVRAPGRNELH
ncbi:MAG: hypothetical protein V4628_10980 [Pseudomonadota bacterium]